jgi:hypothetical protein
VRFNDYHKLVCATLRLEKDQARELRSFLIRLHFRDISPNAAVALTKIEMERRAKVAELAQAPQEPARVPSD